VLFGLATVPSRLSGGRMADRRGRRPTIVLGLLGCSVALLVIAVSPSVSGAAAGAALLGLAFEIYERPSQALLAEMVAPEQRPQALGLLGAALAAGIGAGILAVLLGSVSLRLLFVADSVTCVAVGRVLVPQTDLDRGLCYIEDDHYIYSSDLLCGSFTAPALWGCLR
jgi:MFS family permease